MPLPRRLSECDGGGDHRELLRIQRILNEPAISTHPQQTKQDPEPQPTCTTASTARPASPLPRPPPSSVASLMPTASVWAESCKKSAVCASAGTSSRTRLSLTQTGSSMEPGELSRLVELLDELPCPGAVKDKVLSRGVLSAAVAARRCVELLHARGLSRPDALRAILYGLEDVKRKVEFLVGKMGFEEAPHCSSGGIR